MSSLLDLGRAAAYGVLQPGSDVPTGVPLVRVCDISGGRVEVQGLKRIVPEIAAKYPRTKLRGGELLVTLVGTIGRTALAPASLAGANIARAVGMFPLANDVVSRYVQLALEHPSKNAELVDLAREVARKTLNLGLIKQVDLPIPPIDEQNEIVRRVEALFKLADAIEARVAAAAARADRLTQSILARAFRGELVLQDPNDEPASALLARIRNARG